MPTSSANQASSAPLRKVQPKPHNAMAAITQPATGTRPIAIIAAPETIAAITTDKRREYRSATMAVGISKQK